MFQGVDFYILSCLLVTVETHSGLISPPENLTLQWITDFDLQLNWAPSKHSMQTCTYEVDKSTTNDENDIETSTGPPPWTQHVEMEGGFLKLSVKSDCNGRKSEPVVFIFSDPDLVRDLRCHIHSSKKTHCSWTPNVHAPDLSFFYELLNEDLTIPVDNRSRSHVQACSLYTYNDSVRTGCELSANRTQDVLIVFNGTVKNGSVRNTFRRNLKSNVRPHSLDWEVKKIGGKFLISWTPPDISDPPDWKFIINYTECNTTKTKVVSGKTSAELDMVPHCRYRMSIKAMAEGVEMPWSKDKYFNAEKDPAAMMRAAIIIPLVAFSLATLAFVCGMKYKDRILPRVPIPRDLLSDISDNNIKATVSHLFSPEEEEECEITEVIDPLNNKLIS